MFARALFVLLLVLNVGVATWWATRAPPAAPAAVVPPIGVARLQLVGEAPGGGVVVSPPATETLPSDAVGVTAPAVSAAAGATAATMQCYSFGPFSNDQATVAAQARLQPLTQRMVVRELRRGSARGWQVMLPPLPSAEQAAATAQRIAAAGFSDYFIVREGAQANAIALGRYGNEAAARRRAEALVAAGFAARAEPLGGAVIWLDVMAAAGFDALAAQRLVAAPERRELDCAALR